MNIEKRRTKLSEILEPFIQEMQLHIANKSICFMQAVILLYIDAWNWNISSEEILGKHSLIIEFDRQFLEVSEMRNHYITNVLYLTVYLDKKCSKSKEANHRKLLRKRLGIILM